MIVCDCCGKPLPIRSIRNIERVTGQVVTGGLCEECSPTGTVTLETDIPKEVR